MKGKIITEAHVREQASPRMIPTSSASEKKPPEIQVIRQGEEIEAIEVTCSCGEHIRLRCLS